MHFSNFSSKYLHFVLRRWLKYGKAFMETLKYLYLNNAVISLFSMPLQMGHKDTFLLIKYCLGYVLLEEIQYCFCPHCPGNQILRWRTVKRRGGFSIVNLGMPSLEGLKSWSLSVQDFYKKSFLWKSNLMVAKWCRSVFLSAAWTL